MDCSGSGKSTKRRVVVLSPYGKFFICVLECMLCCFSALGEIFLEMLLYAACLISVSN